MTDGSATLRQLLGLMPRDAIDRLDPGLIRLIRGEHGSARKAQWAPAGDWTTWLVLAGRGFGKTRAGSMWVADRAKARGGTRIALVGATMADVRGVMVEGDAGVMARDAPRPHFEPSRRLLTWSNGSTATLFSAAEPDSLRGPSFHFAWGDEAARWTDGEAVLSNLRLGLRLGDHPQLLLTTTPRPLPWLKALAAEGPGVAVTRGRTLDNRANLPPSFIANVIRDYGGTRLGRQELDGELIDDFDGALWTRGLLETARARIAPSIARTVIGVDPPASSGSRADTCGIVVVGLGTDRCGYVIADRSVQGATPDGWARAVVQAADFFSADRIVAEANNGGNMVESVLRAVNNELPLTLVRASAGKVARAEPVAALYALGRVRHVGPFPALEDELCGLLTGGTYAGPGRSPDRADALVWALTELLLGKGGGEPTVRSL